MRRTCSRIGSLGMRVSARYWSTAVQDWDDILVRGSAILLCFESSGSRDMGLLNILLSF